MISSNMTGKVSGVPIVQLVVFALAFQPAIYVLFKHGRRGILGWIAIQSFCAVRIVGSILLIIQERNQTPRNLATLIIGSIGLSPLLIACLGIIHEARQARNPNLRSSVEWFRVFQFHGLISVAMAMIIIGIVRIDSGTDLSASHSIYMKVGFVIIFLCWFLLALGVLLSLQAQVLDTATAVPGTKLLYGVVITLPFLFVRLIYGVCYFFVTNATFQNSVAIKVVLSVIPEMIAVAALVHVGLVTRKMWKLKMEPQI